ncbi:MAG: ATPase P [Burkholderiales bacterium 68-10]|nr:MAG: ATPase P [Burkholderiales bacterium 68-10]
MFKSVKFTVTGAQRLNCEKCEQRVTRLLNGLPGTKQVRAQAAHQQIDVLFDSALLDEAAITAHLREDGYETQVVG